MVLMLLDIHVEAAEAAGMVELVLMIMIQIVMVDGVVEVLDMFILPMLRC